MVVLFFDLEWEAEDWDAQQARCAQVIKDLRYAPPTPTCLRTGSPCTPTPHPPPHTPTHAHTALATVRLDAGVAQVVSTVVTRCWVTGVPYLFHCHVWRSWGFYIGSLLRLQTARTSRAERSSRLVVVLLQEKYLKDGTFGTVPCVFFLAMPCSTPDTSTHRAIKPLSSHPLSGPTLNLKRAPFTRLCMQTTSWFSNGLSVCVKLASSTKDRRCLCCRAPALS